MGTGPRPGGVGTPALYRSFQLLHLLGKFATKIVQNPFYKGVYHTDVDPSPLSKKMWF